MSRGRYEIDLKVGPLDVQLVHIECEPTFSEKDQMVSQTNEHL